MLFLTKQNSTLAGHGAKQHVVQPVCYQPYLTVNILRQK